MNQIVYNGFTHNESLLSVNTNGSFIVWNVSNGLKIYTALTNHQDIVKI
jgi:hypothetical protein